MAKKQVLGKGIASLIEGKSNKAVLHDLKNIDQVSNEKPAIEEKKPKHEGEILMVPTSKIDPCKGQPRKIFKEKELHELSHSIKENGIIQPLIVREDEGRFELIAGERRLRAAKLAGVKQVPVLVKRATQREQLIMAMIENIQRSDLNCVEEALGYFQLMDDYQLTQDEVAKKVGKERSTVANFLRILKLPRQVVELLQKELLSFGHAKLLAAVLDTEKATRLANEAAIGKWSVRELESQIKKGKRKAHPQTNKFFDEKLDQLKEKLEKSTGYHFQINAKSKGAGEIKIKYSNEAEFNDIFEYLLKN